MDEKSCLRKKVLPRRSAEELSSMVENSCLWKKVLPRGAAEEPSSAYDRCFVSFVRKMVLSLVSVDEGSSA